MNRSADVARRLEALSSNSTVRLVTVGRRTRLPRPVTVWFVYLDGRLFVRTSHRTHWYKNLRADPKLEAEIDDLRFSAEAEEVEDEALIQRLRKTYRRRFHIYDVFASLFKLRGDLVFFELKPDPSPAPVE